MRQKLKELILSVGYWTYRTVRKPVQWYQKKFNIQTRGVRVLLIYQNNIVVVRHWYNSWWVLPGGGIKKNETPEQAAVRELAEEVGVADVQLEYQLGVYSNNKEGKNDTVYCFVAFLNAPFDSNKKFNIEISDMKSVSIEELPTGTSSATKARIAEYLRKDITKEIRPWS